MELGGSLHDAQTGGCRDGLHPDQCNQNQGAESTLAFLPSLRERLAEALDHASADSLDLGTAPDAARVMV